VAANVPWGIAAMKGCMSMTIYNNQGVADLGFQMSQETLRFAEESGGGWSKAEVYTFHGCSCYLKGFLDEAEQHLLKGGFFCESLNWLSLGSLASFYLGETYFDRGQYQKSQDYHNKAISLLEHCGAWPSIISSKKIALARARLMNKEKDIDLGSVYKCDDENTMKLYDGTLARYISEILLNIESGNISEVEDWIKRAIERDTQNGMMCWHLAKDYVFYSELVKQKGDHSKSKEYLYKAIEIFKECGADGWVEKYELEMVEL